MGILGRSSAVLSLALAAFLPLVARPAFQGAAAVAQNPTIDPKASALLRHADSALAAVRSITADYEAVQTDPAGKVVRTINAKLSATRPKLLRLELKTVSTMSTRMRTTNERVLLDGSYKWTIAEGTEGPQVTKLPIPSDPIPEVVPVNGFFAGDQWHPMLPSQWSAIRLQDPKLISLKLLPDESWNGGTYRVVEWTYGIGFNLPSDDRTYKTKLYVGADGLIHRIVSLGDNGLKDEYSITNVRTNTDISKETFAYKEPPKATVRDYSKPRVNTTLLPVGSKAPNFSHKTPDGRTMTLAGVLEGKKGAIFKFWGYS
jgi:outer membrane lipoprotein-sorting protein